MSRYDTNSFPLKDEGQYKFQIKEARDAIIPGKNGDIPCVEFVFIYEGEKCLEEWKKKIFISQCAGIFKACGCKEESPGRYDFELDDLKDKFITCTIEHDILNSGKRIEVLVDVEGWEPPKNQDDKAWDA